MFSEAVKNKLSCAAFFFLPGLSYSLVTSRMPAIKESAQIDDLQLGIALFCLGIAGCIGLFFSSRLVRLLKDRPTIAAGASLSTIGLVIAGYANSFTSLVAGFAVIGFGIGLTDALMNAQGMFYERRYKTRSMNLFHAFFSLGGIVGSLTASFCAYLDLSPLFSFLILVVPWTVVCLFGCRYLQEEDRQVASSETSRVNTTKRAYPLILICFGLLSWLAYDIEGSVAEWGSVYMVSSKESDQAVAALVYGLFSGTIFIVRLFGDKLRESVGDFRLLPICSLIVFAECHSYFRPRVLQQRFAATLLWDLDSRLSSRQYSVSPENAKELQLPKPAVSSPSSLMEVCWSYLRRLDGSPLIHRSELPCAWCWFSVHWLL